MTLEAPEFTVVHASLFNPEDWPYVTTQDDAGFHFYFQEKGLCFIGHTHQVRVHRFDGERVKSIRVPKVLNLKKDIKYLVNVGSVGQPRDGSPDSSYVIYDTEKRSVSFRRVRYPFLKAADQILNAGLPQYLALRLLEGK
ncbi:MAG: hypothetical protein HC904_07055 [Blastochloris sp.]|nr:hypothetical protein [Blastochloris sp.]